MSDGSLSFLRTTAAWKRSMEIASKRYGWVPQCLKGEVPSAQTPAAA